MLKSRVLLITAFTLVFVSISLAQESWWDFYDLALDDIRAKNWTLAEERLKAAMRQQPEQGRKVRAYGARFVRYFPEYYLAVVHFHQAKYQEALEEFLRVENKGLIKQGDEEYAELTQLKQQTFAKLNPSSTPPSNLPTPQQQYASLLGEAQQALSSKNYDGAKDLAKRATGLGVQDSRANDLLRKIELAENADSLRAALDRNDTALAQRIAPKVEALDPENSELARLRQLLAKVSSEREGGDKFSTLMARGSSELSSRDYAAARRTANQAKALPGADGAAVQDLLKRIESQETVDALNDAINRRDAVAANDLARKLERLDPRNPALPRLKKEIAQQLQRPDDPFQKLMLDANAALARKNFSESRRLASQAALLPGTGKKSAEDFLQKVDLLEDTNILEAAVTKKDWNLAQSTMEKISKIHQDSALLEEAPSFISEGLAILSFYSGRYEQSVNLLERTIARKDASGKAHFYLGCSYAAMAFLQTKTDQGTQQKEKLLENAKIQFAAARKIDPALRYDESFISPRILQIYERIQ